MLFAKSSTVLQTAAIPTSLIELSREAATIALMLNASCKTQSRKKAPRSTRSLFPHFRIQLEIILCADDARRSREEVGGAVDSFSAAPSSSAEIETSTAVIGIPTCYM